MIDINNPDGKGLIYQLNFTLGDAAVPAEYEVLFGGLARVIFKERGGPKQQKAEYISVGFDSQTSSIHVNTMGRDPIIEIEFLNTLVLAKYPDGNDRVYVIPHQIASNETGMFAYEFYATLDVEYVKQSLQQANLLNRTLLRGCLEHEDNGGRVRTILGNINSARLTNSNDATIVIHNAAGRTGRIGPDYASFN